MSNIAKSYYKLNGNQNFYNDNLDKLANKRKNSTDINNFRKLIKDLLNDNYDSHEDNKKLKKYNK